MDLFPVFFGTKTLKVVIFGGGELARRKARLLAKSHAQIDVIAPVFESDFVEEFAGHVGFAPAELTDALLSEARFVIIASDDEHVVEQAFELARTHHLPVNVVDRPELCDFTIPSILDRGSVVAGIATGGAAPVLAKDIRARLETLMPQRIGELADFARSFRPAVKQRFQSEADRRSFWERMLRGPVADKVLSGDSAGALPDMLSAIEAGGEPEGVVHIVGAGPGDPELLTIKALRVMQDADIVFYDQLVSPDIIDLIRRDADRISVGKSKGHHSVPQEKIHELLIEAAQAGKRVVRLKGGDPFIFGRGGEELASIEAAGIKAHVIPGISSALGCAASSGIPLTHRDHAQSVTFVTGHARSGDVPDLDWEALARPNQTVVVYMGVGTAPAVSAQIIAAGRKGTTPVAVIENGTRENEVRAYGRLRDLTNLITDNGIKGPALLIIGEVAGISKEAIAALTAQLESAA